MRVLWFCNTPANAVEYLNNSLMGSGGWLQALDKSIQNDIELHVAFESRSDILPFKHKSTYYYPIYTPKNKIKKILELRYPVLKRDKDIKEYLKIVEEVSPDLIHIHGTENPFGFIIDKVNVPVCISIQGILSVIGHRYNVGLGERNIDVRKRILGLPMFRIHYRRLQMMAMREEYVLKRCRHIIGRTYWDNIVTRVLASNSKYYLSNEILRDSFYLDNYVRRENDIFEIFTINDNTYYKGFETICLAISILNSVPSIKFCWTVAGINKDDLIVRAVKKELGSRFPSCNLNMIGRLGEKDIVERLKNTSLYVMASHIENSPNSLCEAMILGVPCISTFAGGVSSLVENNKDGILVQDGDPWAMAGAILDLYNNKEKRIKLGESARIRAIERHNRDNVKMELIEIYKQILIN